MPFLIILMLYLSGIGVCRGALTIVQDKLDVFESSDWFWLLAIGWPLTLIPVAGWIIVESLILK